MAPSPAQLKIADGLKAEGNALFSKGRHAAAIDRYTEAITLCPTNPVLYVNRAMCHKKLGNWTAVVSDARQALSQQSDSMKALYLLGVALREQGAVADAIPLLTKAVEAAREQGDSVKDDIWRELAKAKYASWQADSAARAAEQAALRERLRGLLQQQQPKQEGMKEELARWDRLFEQAAASDRRDETPSAFTCPLTMEIFREPAVTPSGHSYERAALLEHLAKVGNFDPISRVQMTESDVRPNLQLRAATQSYLDSHAYAWSEAI